MLALESVLLTEQIMRSKRLITGKLSSSLTSFCFCAICGTFSTQICLQQLVFFCLIFISESMERSLAVINNLPHFIQTTDSNIFIAKLMTPFFYWTFLLIHQSEVKALFNIPKRRWPNDSLADIHNVHLKHISSCTQFVSANRGCMKIFCPLKSM